MSSIDLSDYKRAKRKMRKYGGGVIPVLTFNQLGNRALEYIFIGKEQGDVVKLCKVFSIQVPRVCSDKQDRGYHYTRVFGCGAEVVTDKLLGKTKFINRLWARELGVGDAK